MRAQPLNTQGVPREVRPLLDALNHLFARTHTMMTRERRFTSDAAHELRSPLAALKVQTDVAQLSHDDPQAREKALAQLHAGIDRASRLVDQLLTLSRLDSLDNLDDVEPIALADLLQSAVLDIWHPAQQAGIDIRLNICIRPPSAARASRCCSACWCATCWIMRSATARGAAWWTSRWTRVALPCATTAPALSDEVLTRAGERFYRPPGQNATGSGLGFSIVKRIAALHGMRVSLSNAPEGGFEVKVSW